MLILMAVRSNLYDTTESMLLKTVNIRFAQMAQRPYQM